MCSSFRLRLGPLTLAILTTSGLIRLCLPRIGLGIDIPCGVFFILCILRLDLDWALTVSPILLIPFTFCASTFPLLDLAFAGIDVLIICRGLRVGICVIFCCYSLSLLPSRTLRSSHRLCPSNARNQCARVYILLCLDA